MLVAQLALVAGDELLHLVVHGDQVELLQDALQLASQASQLSQDHLGLVLDGLDLLLASELAGDLASDLLLVVLLDLDLGDLALDLIDQLDQSLDQMLRLLVLGDLDLVWGLTLGEDGLLDQALQLLGLLLDELQLLLLLDGAVDADGGVEEVVVDHWDLDAIDGDGLLLLLLLLDEVLWLGELLLNLEHLVVDVDVLWLDLAELTELTESVLHGAQLGEQLLDWHGRVEHLAWDDLAQVLDQLGGQLLDGGVLLLAGDGASELLGLVLELVLHEVLQVHQLRDALERVLLALLLLELLLEEHDVLLQLLQLLLAEGAWGNADLGLDASQLLDELLNPLLGQSLLDLLLDADDWESHGGGLNLTVQALLLLLDLLSQNSLVLAQLLLQLLDLLDLGGLEELGALDAALELMLDMLDLLGLLDLLLDLVGSQVAGDLTLLLLDISNVQLGLDLLDELVQLLLLLLQALLLLGLLLQDLRLLGPHLAAGVLAHDASGGLLLDGLQCLLVVDQVLELHLLLLAQHALSLLKLLLQVEVDALTLVGLLLLGLDEHALVLADLLLDLLATFADQLLLVDLDLALDLLLLLLLELEVSLLLLEQLLLEVLQLDLHLDLLGLALLLVLALLLDQFALELLDLLGQC